MNKSLLNNLIVVAVELIIVLLMVIGILPREMSLFMTGLLIVYFIFNTPQDSLWVFVASLPLFVVLPLSQGFDSMANWRLLLSILFIVWFVRKFRGKEIIALKQWVKKELSNKFVAFSLIFIFIAGLSLIGADDRMMGLKKILFFINIGLIFFVAKDLIKKKGYLAQLMQAVGVALGLSLLVGYGQFVSTLFVPLHIFWKFWAATVIPIFYGLNLSILLENSNTWFAYYYAAPPTLRIFSVFPDSHSFAMFCVIGLSYVATWIFIRDEKKKGRMYFLYLFLALTLMALLFTGSRGVWVSALVPLLLLITLVSAGKWLALGKKKLISWLALVGRAKISQLILGSLVILFLLFPISSVLMFSAQQRQIGTMDGDYLMLLRRARSAIDFNETSVKNRWQIWQKTIESMERHPWLGVGIGNYAVVLGEDVSAVKRGASAHNLYFDIASEMGFFALFVFMAMGIQILITAGKVYRESKGAAAIFAASFGLYFVWILSYSLFDVVLFNDKVLLFFMLSLGVIYGTKTAKSSD